MKNEIEINPQYNHGKNLIEFIKKNSKHKYKKELDNILEKYIEYRKKIDAINFEGEDSIRSMVLYLNEYRSISIVTFDKLTNSGQKALGYTILEEFFFIMFDKIMCNFKTKHENVFIGKGNSYVSLSFTPNCFEDAFNNPQPHIHTKDQDFVLGVAVDIDVKSKGVNTINKKNNKTVIPVVAIECKTYLEKNMLDSCAATATRLKNAMPYCIYMVASEYMKMDESYPELTDIDEVYILCKKKNSERIKRSKEGKSPFNIDEELIVDLYKRVERHLNSIWWSPEDAIERGKIICRPI